MADPGPDVHLRRLPAERKPVPSVVLPQFGCCSCCCCCLHTLGGLIGGVAGSTSTIPEEPKPVDPDFPFPFRRDELENEPDLLPVTALYWLLVLFVFSWVPAWFVVTDGPTEDSFFSGVVLGLIFLPAVQLGASILTALGVALFYIDRVNAFRRLGKITLASFIGTLIGIGIMAGFCGLFLFNRW